jgi:DivIVA domain-containing protein
MPNIIDNIKKEILEKKFKKNNQIGYDPDEVDEFFDKMISLFNKLNEILIAQIEKNNDLTSNFNEIKSENNSLKTLVASLNNELDSLHMDGYGHNKLNKRVSDIEKLLTQIAKDKKNEK